MSKPRLQEACALPPRMSHCAARKSAKPVLIPILILRSLSPLSDPALPGAQIFFRAAADIPRGSELLLNYGDCYWEDYEPQDTEEPDVDPDSDDADASSDEQLLPDMSQLLAGVSWSKGIAPMKQP